MKNYDPLEPPALNKDLLYGTLDAVVAADILGTWNQQDWLRFEDPDDDGSEEVMERAERRQAATGEWCGTTCCYAGHALLIEGGRLVYDEGRSYILLDKCLLSAGSVSPEAMQRLGLTEWEASTLFSANNSLQDLKEIVDAIAAGKFRGDWG